MYRGKISVRKIVEFVLRRGSIDSRRNSSNTAQEGARIHRKLQKEAGDGYQKEVTLKIETEIKGDQLVIEGRADGLFQEADLWVVDEIKTSDLAFEELSVDQKEMFFFQGMVYAHIVAQEQQLDKIGVRLTYFQTIKERITREVRKFSQAELAEFFTALTTDYHKWLVFQENWRRVRNTSLTALAFPYEDYRKGQRELAVAAYKTLKSQQRLFIEAPTGTGKTISTLFPALKVMGEDEADRIFYLTAKTITRQVAEDAIKALAGEQAEVKSVTLTAKDKICFLEERNCTPEHCPYADGYYNRINEGLWDLLHHENQITREVIEAYARKHNLCPFELSLDVSLWCDVIIGDYNYLFDPTVYLRRFFEENEEEYFFLVDEAHNLVNRSREMYSASLKRSQFSQLKAELGKNQQKIKRALTKVENEFDLLESIGAEAGWQYHHQKPAVDTLLKRVLALSEKLQEWLLDNPEHPAQEKALSVYFECLHYTRISEYYDDHYETTVELRYRDVIIKQFCIDPAPFLQMMLDKGKSSLLFSASFSPLGYYQEILGGGDDALRYKLPSPFSPERQAVLIDDGIQTTYQRRQATLPRLVTAIYETVQARTGNYLVFFPSYKYLDEAVERFQEAYPEIQLLIQDTIMTEEEREAFLAKFETDPSSTLVGFCVLGGIFSEGIDLKGSRLIGSIIVGVGLPQMNPETELIKEYFDETKQAGFAYAYQLPGMNKVLQAAGRVIRDERDSGVVVLLDQRFNSPRYRQLFPQHWQNARNVHDSSQLRQAVAEFWQQQDEC